MLCPEKERNTGTSIWVPRLDEAIALNLLSLALKRAGIWPRTSFPRYTAEQPRASLRMSRPRASCELIGYSPEYNLEKTREDVALWQMRERWIAKPV